MTRSATGIVAPAVRAVGRLPGWVAPVAVGGTALAAVSVIGALDPEVRGHLVPGCPFRALSGLDCPGCGGTRALYALTRGDLATAVDHNLVTVLALPVLALAWAWWLAVRAGWRSQPLTVGPRTSYGLATGLTVFWIVRNLPWAPFAWLGSTAG